MSCRSSTTNTFAVWTAATHAPPGRPAGIQGFQGRKTAWSRPRLRPDAGTAALAPGGLTCHRDIATAQACWFATPRTGRRRGRALLPTVMTLLTGSYDGTQSGGAAARGWVVPSVDRAVARRPEMRSAQAVYHEVARRECGAGSVLSPIPEREHGRRRRARDAARPASVQRAERQENQRWTGRQPNERNEAHGSPGFGPAGYAVRD